MSVSALCCEQWRMSQFYFYCLACIAFLCKLARDSRMGFVTVPALIVHLCSNPNIARQRALPLVKGCCLLSAAIVIL